MSDEWGDWRRGWAFASLIDATEPGHDCDLLDTPSHVTQGDSR